MKTPLETLFTKILPFNRLASVLMILFAIFVYLDRGEVGFIKIANWSYAALFAWFIAGAVYLFFKPATPALMVLATGAAQLYGWRVSYAIWFEGYGAPQITTGFYIGLNILLIWLAWYFQYHNDKAKDG